MCIRDSSSTAGQGGTDNGPGEDGSRRKGKRKLSSGMCLPRLYWKWSHRSAERVSTWGDKASYWLNSRESKLSKSCLKAITDVRPLKSVAARKCWYKTECENLTGGKKMFGHKHRSEKKIRAPKGPPGEGSTKIFKIQKSRVINIKKLGGTASYPGPLLSLIHI